MSKILRPKQNFSSIRSHGVKMSQCFLESVFKRHQREANNLTIFTPFRIIYVDIICSTFRKLGESYKLLVLLMECGLCNYWPRMYKLWIKCHLNGKLFEESTPWFTSNECFHTSLQMYSPKEVLIEAGQETILSCDILSSNF